MIPRYPHQVPAGISAVIAPTRHALVGAHAVNIWIEPRITLDFDVTISGDRLSLHQIELKLAASVFSKTKETATQAPSGPDFQRYRSQDGETIMEFQTAKTPFQHELISTRTHRSGRRAYRDTRRSDRAEADRRSPQGLQGSGETLCSTRSRLAVHRALDSRVRR